MMRYTNWKDDALAIYLGFCNEDVTNVANSICLQDTPVSGGSVSYTHLDQNRLISKEASKWDGAKDAWVPYFKMYEPQATQRVTIVSGQTATVNFNNVLKRGSLEVTKTSESSFSTNL